MQNRPISPSISKSDVILRLGRDFTFLALFLALLLPSLDLDLGLDHRRIAKCRLLAAGGRPTLTGESWVCGKLSPEVTLVLSFSSVYLLFFFRAQFEHIVHHGSYLLCLQVSQSSPKEKRIYIFSQVS